MTAPAHRADRGRAVERTGLSWARTFLAATANGALVVVRHDGEVAVGAALVMLSLALLTALGTIAAASRRSAEAHGSTPIAPARVSVWLLAGAVSVLCLTWVVVLVVGGAG